GPDFRILHVPGHAPGQLAIEVDLPETGTVLITGDAISRPAEVEEGFGGSWDVARAQESGARLMKRAAEQDAFVIYGHSPEQWPSLRKSPEAYT
ncbi:MAG: N-acyl homoserine lactonase family protein, partial [Tateyamaria sp.]